MENLQPDDAQVNNGVPFVEAHASVTRLLDRATDKLKSLEDWSGDDTIGREIRCLRGFTGLLEGMAYSNGWDCIPDKARPCIALLASCLVEDLEAGLSRATKACIADLEAFTSDPSEE